MLTYVHAYVHTHINRSILSDFLEVWIFVHGLLIKIRHHYICIYIKNVYSKPYNWSYVYWLPAADMHVLDIYFIILILEGQFRQNKIIFMFFWKRIRKNVQFSEKAFTIASILKRKRTREKRAADIQMHNLSMHVHIHCLYFPEINKHMYMHL